MKHLLLGLLIVALVSVTACLGHRNSGSKTSAVSVGQPGRGNDGGLQPADPSNPNNTGNNDKKNVGGGDAKNSSPTNPSTKFTPTPTPIGGSNSNKPVDVTRVPSAIKLDASMNGKVLHALYSCGDNVYAVVERPNKVGDVVQTTHRLYVEKKGVNNFEEIIIGTTDDQKKHLFDNLTCLNNQLLVGTFRWLQVTTTQNKEYFFTYRPGDGKIFIDPSYSKLVQVGDHSSWRRPNFRKGTDNVEDVKTDHFKFMKHESDFEVFIFTNDNTFRRITFYNGSIDTLPKRYAFKTINAGAKTYDTTIAARPEGDGVYFANLEEKKNTPNVYRYDYATSNFQAITLTGIDIPNANSDQLDATLISLGDKIYLVYRDITRESIIKAYEISVPLANGTSLKNLTALAVDSAAKFMGNRLVSNVVYADNGVYAFINDKVNKNMLTTLATDVSGRTLVIEEYSSFLPEGVPARYAYTLKLNELQKILNAFGVTGKVMAVANDAEDFYLSVPRTTPVVYRGKLEDFVDWANGNK